METSAFLYENLSYSMLIWLHFGTSMLISYSFFLYVLPIVYNIVVLYLPSFKYGFKDADGHGGSGLPVIPAELIKTLKDSKVFAGIFSRNPKLFSTVKADDTKVFFEKLDNQIDEVLVKLKDLPIEEGKENKEQGEESVEQGTSGNVQETVSAEIAETSQTDIDKQQKKVRKKKFLLYGNLIFVIAIVAVNVYSYFYYSGILSEYFVVKKGLLKNSGDDYSLVYGKLRDVKDSVKVERIKEINTYVEIINSVKADKRKREAEESEAKEAEGKK